VSSRATVRGSMSCYFIAVAKGSIPGLRPQPICLQVMSRAVESSPTAPESRAIPGRSTDFKHRS
jgi:hypothetical protein